MGYLLSCVAFIIQRAFPLDCGMHSLRIVEFVDVGCDSLLDLLTCAPGLPPQESAFKVLKKLSVTALSQQFPFLLMDTIKPWAERS